MIYHIREEEKKVAKSRIGNLEEVLSDLESLSVRYDEEATFELEAEGLIKLLKKGRYNYTDGKILFKLNYTFKDKLKEIIEMKVKEDNGVYYLTTKMVSERENEGISEIDLIDNIELMTIGIILERLLFKIAEITMKVSYEYETDSEVREELEAVAKKLNWLGDLKEEEIKSQELNLSNLELVLALSKETNKDLSYKIKEDMVGVGFKKYRSEKIISEFNFGVYSDSLKVVKNEDGKYYYELMLTKIDNYKDKKDVLKVKEVHELTEYGFERLVRDLIPVYIETVKSRLTAK